MSIRLMSAIFENVELGPTERLIMLALADHADEVGRCYPSIQRLCQRTGLSERAVQTNTRKLAAAGYLRISIGGGKGNSNLYVVSPNPAADAPQTPQQVRSNPAADAPEPLRTVIEPVKEAASSRARQISDDLVADLIHVLGFDRGQVIPKYWIAPDASLIVNRWQSDLRLTRDEILQVATQNAVQHNAPANGPKTLIRAMSDFAAAKAAPPLVPTQTTTGARNGKPPTPGVAFGQAMRQLADDLSAGRVTLRTDNRDPFAPRPGRDTQAG